MMRNGKRIGAALLTAALMLSQLGATAYAEGNPAGAGEITVTDLNELSRKVKHQNVPSGAPEIEDWYGMAVQSSTSDYDSGDVAVINAMIENNNLSATKNDPEGWKNEGLVIWNLDSPKKITELSLNANSLHEALDVSNLTCLTNLSCMNNELTGLNLTGLTNLTKLDCSDNLLGTLDVTDLTSLTSLQCENNKLKALPGLGNLTNLTFLRCVNNELPALPGLESLTRLTELYCGDNKLKALPGLGNLTNLTMIRCDHNELPELPGLENLTKLTQLYCEYNELPALPGLGELTGLTTLSCGNNELPELPGLGNLTKLTQLYCGNNELTALPGLGNLTKLTELRCENNKLTELPGLENLTSLTQLYCGDNELTALDVSNLSSLEKNKFSCSGNPLQFYKTSDGALTINAGTHGILSIASYQQDTKVITLVPKPDIGYIFGMWTALPSGVTPQDDNRIIFELSSDQKVAATFIGTDATLKALSLSAGTLTPAFNPAITAYTASVDNGVTSVTITAGPNDPVVKVIGDGAHDLKVGDNPFTITVTAEDKSTTKTYTVTVTRAAAATTGGGSGGGGASRNYSIIPPEADNPVLAVIELPVAVGNGTATGKPDDGRTSSALAEAGRNDKAKTNGIAIQYDAETSKTYDSFSVTMGRATLDRLIAAKVKYVTLHTGVVDLTFDLAALQEIQKQAAGDMTLTAARETGLTGDALAAIGSRPAYRLSVSYTGADGKAATVDSFGAGRVTVGLAYTPAQTEQTGSLYLVYSADGKGADWLYQSSYKVNFAEGEKEGGRNKNSGNVIASVGHFSVYGVGYQTAPAFTDTAGHWAKPDIDFVVSRGLFSGTSETAFTPNGTITRGMFVTALGRLSGIDPLAFSSSRYTDVAVTAYYAPYVEWAASKGIVSGTGEKAFSPDAPITREQMAVMMQRYAGKLGYALPATREVVTFTDDDQITGSMKDAVQAIQRAGIMSGKGNGRFGPGDAATRAEAAVVLRRFAEIAIDPATAGGQTQDAGR